MFVDTHCHLDRYADPQRVLKSAAAARVLTVAVTELPSGFQRMELTLRGASSLRLALGVHPLRASTAGAMELRLFTRLLRYTSFVGEIGLDYSQQGLPTKRRQLEVFERLLSEQGIREKVVSVHTRRAEADTIARLRQARVRAILHWYSGPAKLIDDALDAGMYFSVNSAMLRSRGGQRILDALPPERVLAESDGPYTKVTGRVSEPRDMPSLVAELATRWGMSRVAARDRVAENLRALVRCTVGEHAVAGVEGPSGRPRPPHIKSPGARRDA